MTLVDIICDIDCAQVWQFAMRNYHRPESESAEFTIKIFDTMTSQDSLTDYKQQPRSN